MAFEQKDNYGVLYPFDEKYHKQKGHKISENHPHFEGNIQEDGKKYQLAAWKKTDKTGKKYLSLKRSEPMDSSGHRPMADDTNDDSGIF